MTTSDTTPTQKADTVNRYTAQVAADEGALSGIPSSGLVAIMDGTSYPVSDRTQMQFGDVGTLQTGTYPA